MLSVVGITSIAAGIALIRAGLLEITFGAYLQRAMRLAAPSKPVQQFPGAPGAPSPPEPERIH